MSSQEIFLRIRSVSAKVGLARSTIYMLIQRGDFPAPIKLGGRASAWSSSEVEQWQQARIDERGKAA